MTEFDTGVIIAQILVPTIGSVIAVWKIGNKIKEALCTQISELTIELRTHTGIAGNYQEEFDKLKERVTNIILRNGLKE